MSLWLNYSDDSNTNRQVAGFVRKHTVTSAEATATTLSVTFPEAPASLDAVTTQAYTSANVDKSGLKTTWSGRTVTVANNGSTTTLVSGDILIISALGSNAI